MVLAERGGVSYIGCFVLPNGKCDDDDLSKWLVPLENLEAAAGLIPFPDALTDETRDALAAAEDRWCPRGSGINAGRAREQAGIRHLCDLLPANALAARKALPP